MKTNRPFRFSLHPSLAIILLASVILSACTTEEEQIFYNIWSEDGGGIMNCSGEWVVAPLDRSMGILGGPMADGYAPITRLDDGWNTFINMDGEIAFDWFERALPFSEGLAAVKIDGLWGYIDTSGALVIPAQFPGLWAGSFSDGLANVVLEVGNFNIPRSWIYINTKGQQVLGPYRTAESFHDGAAAVTSAGDEHISGFIDTRGNFLLQFSVDEGLSPGGAYSGGLFPVTDIMKQFKEGTCAKGFMDGKKNWVIEPQFCHVGVFVDGLAPVSRQSDMMAEAGFGYINTSGKMVISEAYQMATDFSGGCARVTWNNLNGYGLIDSKGRFIYQYESGK